MKIARLTEAEDEDKIPLSHMESGSDMEGIEEGDVDLQGVQKMVIFYPSLIPCFLE